MTIAHRFIGIDVSKTHLDVYDKATAKSWRVANSAAAIAALLAGWPHAVVCVAAPHPSPLPMKNGERESHNHRFGRRG